MPRNGRRALLVGLWVFTLSALAPPYALADAGDDPRDVNSPLDVERVSHSTEGEYGAWRLDTYDGFDNAGEFYQARWDFDLNGDGTPAEACILVEYSGEGDILRGALYPGCGAEVWATTNATNPGRNSIEVRFLLRDLVHGAGLTTGDGFAYRVTVVDLNQNRDVIPDEGLVEQDGLPDPPKATAAPQGEGATTGGSDPAADVGIGGAAAGSDGVPPGEGPEGAAGLGQSSGQESLVRRTATSPATWALALGLPGLVLIAVIVARRRRGRPLPAEPRPELTPALVGADGPRASEDAAAKETTTGDAWLIWPGAPETIVPSEPRAAPVSEADVLFDGAPTEQSRVHDSDT